MIRHCFTSQIQVGCRTRQPAPPAVRKQNAHPPWPGLGRRAQIESLPKQRVSRISDADPDYQSIRNSGTLRYSVIRPMPTPSSTGLSTMPTASSCGGTRCAAANRIRLGMKRINQINNLQHLSTLLTQFTNRPPRSLETIIMTRVLALADQSKIGCITQRRFAKVGASVLEGAIRSQVNDGPVTTYKAGQSFSELPGDRHGVSANASKTKPAKLLAVFVVDTNETELTIPSGTEV